MVGDIGHELMADFPDGHITPDDPILDAGAGSGPVGQALGRRRLRNIDTCDLSIGMLEQARACGVYRDVRVGVPGAPLDCDDGECDVAIGRSSVACSHRGMRRRHRSTNSGVSFTPAV